MKKPQPFQIDRVGLLLATLGILWSISILVASQETWNPLVKFSSTINASAPILRETFLNLPSKFGYLFFPAGWVLVLLYSQWTLGASLESSIQLKMSRFKLNQVERIVLGQGVFGLIIFGMGLTSNLSPLWIFITVILIFSYGILRFHPPLQWGTYLKSIWKRLTNYRNTTFEGWIGRTLLVGVVAVFLFIAFLVAIHPIWLYDVLVYHFGTPQSWLLNGSFIQNTFDFFVYLSGQAEALTTAAIAVGGFPAAQLFNYSFLILTLVWTYEVSVNFRWRWLPVILIGTCPVIVLISALSKPDIIYILYGTIALFRLVEGARLGDWPKLLIGTLALSLCLATKLTGILFVAFPLLLTLPFYAFTNPDLSPRTHWKAWLSLGVLSMVFVAPAFIRNTVWTGNPFFPSGFSLFGGPDWSVAQSQLVWADGHFRPDPLSLTHWVTKIKKLIFSPYGTLIRNYGAFGVLGPLWAWLIPIGVVLSFRTRRNVIPWIVFGLGVIFFLNTFEILRYAAVLLPFTSLLIAESMPWPARKLEWSVAILAGALCISVNLTYVLRESLSTTRGFAFIQHNMSTENYLTQLSRYRPIELGNYPLTRILNRKKNVKQVLLIGDAVHAYVETPHMHSSPYNSPVIRQFLIQATTPQELSRKLVEGEVSHIIVNIPELQRLEKRKGMPSLNPDKRELLHSYLSSSFVTCIGGDCSLKGPALLEIQSVHARYP